MKTWKKIVLGLAALFVLLVAVLGIGGLAIDPKIDLDVEKQLAASPAQLDPFLQSASGLQEWWAAAQEGSEQKMTVKKKSGPDAGAGLVVTFEADGHVMETWEVKSAEPGRVVYLVDFAGMMTVERTITVVEERPGITRATWRETGELGNPFMRWMKVMMPADSIEKNFTMALSALDKAAESKITPSAD